MDDYNRNIGSKPRDPFEKIEISRVEKKEENQERPPSIEEEKHGIFAFSVLNCMKKIMNFFTSFAQKKELTLNLRTASKAFKDQLEKLKKENLSESPEFLNALSATWIDFMDAYEYEYGTVLI